MLLASEELTSLLIALDHKAYEDTVSFKKMFRNERSIVGSFLGSGNMIQSLHAAGVQRVSIVVLYALGSATGVLASSATDQVSFSIGSESNRESLATIIEQQIGSLSVMRVVDPNDLTPVLEPLKLSNNPTFAIRYSDAVLKSLGYRTEISVFLQTMGQHSEAQISSCSESLSAQWEALTSRLRLALLGLKEETLVREVLDPDYRKDWEIGVSRARQVLSPIEHAFGKLEQLSVTPTNDIEVTPSQEYHFGERYKSQIESQFQKRGLGKDFKFQFPRDGSDTIADAEWDKEPFNFICDEETGMLQSSKRFSGWFCNDIDSVIDSLAKSYRLLTSSNKGFLVLVLPNDLYQNHIESFVNLNLVERIEIIGIRRVV